MSENKETSKPFIPHKEKVAKFYLQNKLVCRSGTLHT